MENSEEYYWDLTLRDGRVIPIPPHAVHIVKAKMQSRDPIVTTNFTIPFAEIRSFDKTSRKHDERKLLAEQVAQAFGEPLITIDEQTGAKMVKARWVKKEVTDREYSSYYGKSPVYKRLYNGDNGLIWVAFTLPVHQIDTDRVTECTAEEVIKLSKY